MNRRAGRILALALIPMLIGGCATNAATSASVPPQASSQPAPTAQPSTSVPPTAATEPTQSTDPSAADNDSTKLNVKSGCDLLSPTDAKKAIGGGKKRPGPITSFDGLGIRVPAVGCSYQPVDYNNDTVTGMFVYFDYSLTPFKADKWDAHFADAFAAKRKSLALPGYDKASYLVAINRQGSHTVRSVAIWAARGTTIHFATTSGVDGAAPSLDDAQKLFLAT